MQDKPTLRQVKAYLDRVYLDGPPGDHLFDSKNALVASLDEFKELIPEDKRNEARAFKIYARRTYVHKILDAGADPEQVLARIALFLG